MTAQEIAEKHAPKLMWTDGTVAGAEPYRVEEIRRDVEAAVAAEREAILAAVADLKAQCQEQSGAYTALKVAVRSFAQVEDAIRARGHA